MSEYAIEMRGITKRFPGIVANDNIDLCLKKGEIHALLGENGAGKSTLMKILFGMYQPDEGEILMNGKKVVINNPNDANDLGIGMVHQHFMLVQNFSVVDNIILGNEPVKKGFIDKKEARKKVLDVSKKYNLNVDPDAIVENISVGMQQRVEILKMLYRDNDILIFDEPTAVLTVQEIAELMQIMKDLAAEGKSILLITHKFNEIMSTADRCTVIRKGRYTGTVDIKDTTPEKLAQMMVGRNVNFKVEKGEAHPGEVVLEALHMSVSKAGGTKKLVNNVSFKVRKGEIVGFAGIDGNGLSELLYGISGLMPMSGGTLLYNGKDITKSSIKEKIKLGLNYIPEDRHKHGLVLDYSIEDNIILRQQDYPSFSNGLGLLNTEVIRGYSDHMIDEYDIRSGQGSISIAGGLSGGNQQKIIVAREMDRDHDFIIVAQPTRGVDVGAIEFIHKKIVEQRDEGKAILLMSFELDEIMDLSDRIIVLYEGEIVGEFNPKEVTVEELGLYMIGAKRMEAANEG